MDSEITAIKDAKVAEVKAAAATARAQADVKNASELQRLKELKQSGLFERNTPSDKTDFTAGGTTLTLVEFRDTAAAAAEQHQTTNLSLEGATMVVGFPGLTLTPAIVTGYLREQLKLQLLGVVHSAAFPARCLIEDGQPVLPIRIFGNSKLCVVLCEFKLSTNELVHLMTKALFHFAIKRKIHIITVIEGLPLDNVDDEKAQRLAFVSTCQKFSTTMLTLKHDPLGESVIVGPAGAILGESTLDGRIHVGCLIAPTSAEYPDVRSAIACVKALSTYCSLDVDIEPMKKKSDALVQSVKRILKSESRPSVNMYT